MALRRLLLGPQSYSQLAETKGFMEGLTVAVEAGSLQLKSSALFVLSQLALLGDLCVRERE